MGNSSSSHHQHCHSTSMSHEMGRGWTQSFPRELNRHHAQQPPGNKVLPEPSNQRLRTTNNGNIIHNGGTISGRRPSSLTLPHDANKQGVYRSRSTSASNIGELHGRKYNQENQQCCAGHYRPCDGSCRDEMVQLKRFGSEPDLRYSPTEPKRQSDTRQSNGYYPEREMRERESRYRGKKKYKAPTPPINCDGSSPDSYKWEIIGQDQRDYCRQDENDVGGDNGVVQAPPRRSRLFKTRAETKKQTSNWPMSTSTLLSQQDGNNCIVENERRWRSEKQQQQQQQQQQHQQQQQQQHRASGKENRPVWRDREQDRWSKNERRNSKKFDGKNTLQRSLSSPEFQAELVQVAKKVRNKLYYNRRIDPVGAPVITNNTEFRMDNSFISKSMDRKTNKISRQDIGMDDRREKQKNRINQESFETNNCDGIRTSAIFYEEKKLHERGGGRGENRVIRRQEIRSSEKRTMDGSLETKANDRLDERLENGGSDVGVSRRRVLEKSTTFEESVTSNGGIECIFTRSSMNNRVDGVGNMKDQQRSSMRHSKEFDCRNDRSKISAGSFVKTRNNGEAIGHARTRSESPVMRQSGDRMDVRGQGSGRESTPEPPRGKEKKVADNRHKRTNVKDASYGNCEKRWSERNDSRIEKIQIKSYEKNIVNDSKEIEKNWNFSNSNIDQNSSRDLRDMNQQQHMNRIHPKSQDNNYSKSPNNRQNELEEKNHNGDIALKLRPTLPKKQLEIPRFSPSAAWRLLSAVETSGPATSTVSEEVPVMYEERIERMSRPPPLLIALGPRSSHDKSGDSGVSCDAGMPNDELPDVSTDRMKNQTSRPAWTPQQDLGEESSSDAGVDSPPPMAPDVKFSPRAHVFSLSLPRDDNRHGNYVTDKSKSNNAPFNSLQKMRKSVSGAFGLANSDFDRKRPGETLDDNWLLSTSAPTSLQHNQVNQINHKDDIVKSKRGWEINYDVADFEDEALGESDEKTEFPIVMKPPSFSYLASGGHVMYLPSNSTGHRTQNHNFRDSLGDNNTKSNSNITGKNVKTNEHTKNTNKSSFINGFCNGFNNKLTFNKSQESLSLRRERSFTDLENNKNRKHSSFSKSCENISEMRQYNGSQSHHRFAESLQDKKIDTSNLKVTIKPNPKGKRFTFQSTVRQIERRRLAEKLSREAEAKERQRKNELEAMRKVEEEFQRKRAKEKANIRQQLRLYSMDENSSLPPASDSSHLSRADPDGAPSSSASSPTSAPPGKLAANNRKGSVINGDYHRKKECRIQQQKHEPREYKDYRIKYYDWAPNNDSSSALEIKQTTIHPKVVCDIPKSSHVFIDTNLHTSKSTNLNSTPRSDNYRKDFAHGAIAGRSSLASSDSELSQPNTRPHSRQNGNKSSKPVRTRMESSSPKDDTERENRTTLTRSTSPPRSVDVTYSEEETPVEPVKQERNPVNIINGFILNSVQPFVRNKSYRPISFNSQQPPPPPPPPPLSIRS